MSLIILAAVVQKVGNAILELNPILFSVTGESFIPSARTVLFLTAKEKNFLKLCRVYSNSLKMSNVSEFPRISWGPY